MFRFRSHQHRRLRRLSGSELDGIRRRRRPAQLHRMLIDTGRTLFAEQGYQATPQKQIATDAGVSTSVLFRNFGSKSQLLVEAVIEPFGVACQRDRNTSLPRVWDHLEVSGSIA